MEKFVTLAASHRITCDYTHPVKLRLIRNISCMIYYTSGSYFATYHHLLSNVDEAYLGLSAGIFTEYVT